jgi:hypothetical protein
MTKIPDQIHKLALQNTDPLFLTDSYLSGGHGSQVANGTLTYVRFCNRLYGITCGHVVEEAHEKDKLLSVHGKESYVYQFSRESQTNAKNSFISLSGEGLDVAVVALPERFCELHFEKKGKVAIELESLKEPGWEDVVVPVAFGYPTEQKDEEGGFVQAPLAGVAAELTNPICQSDEKFTLFSTLEHEHNTFFSGMSGGPVFHLLNPSDPPTLIGIIFEGLPGSSQNWLARDAQSFLSMKDIQIFAYRFTPQIFQSWLDLAKIDEA